MAGYYSPRAAISRWFGRSPTGTEERFEENYRQTPDSTSVAAGSVAGEPTMSVEDPEVVVQPVGSPDGQPGGTAVLQTVLQTPLDVVTSTPAAPELVVKPPVIVPELLTGGCGNILRREEHF
eukprot:GHVR01163926.1.p1 GENE.GHVR01163926.1~~GHVR01163926.1.p1  ORF type:complete len:122 (+),score=20.45 GHVR01163926.1:52-417(+)